MDTQNQTPQNSYQKPPTVIDGLIQPGFPAKVFSALFFDFCVVFVKSGSFGTNSSGTMRASLGGFTKEALLMGAIGTLIDGKNRESRINNTASMASNSLGVIVQAHKLNFLLLYDKIEKVEMKGPNFAGEIKLSFYANGQRHKFRLDKQSKTTLQYYYKVLNEFVPGILC